MLQNVMKFTQQISTGAFLIILMIVAGCTVDNVEISPTESEEVANRAVANDSLTPTFEVNSTISTKVTTPALIDAELSIELVPALDSRWALIPERINELQGLNTIAVSPDGDLFAAVESYDETSKIYLWEVATGSARWVIELDQPLATTKLVFSPDSSQLAVGTSEAVPYIFVWDVHTGNLLHHFLYPAYTRDMSFSTDSGLLAVAGIFPGKITIWDLDSESVNEIGEGNAVSFVPGVANSVVAVAGERQFESELPSVYLLDLNNGQQQSFFPNDFFADGVAVSHDGQYLATFVSNQEGYGNLRVVDLRNNVELDLEANEIRQAQQIRQITFSNHGQLGVLQRDLTVWNVEENLLGSIDALEVKGFLFTPDGSYLITFGNFQTLPEIWKLPLP
ncbi:MAG: WD40 repeat domain-containing protein [Anaerolineaceae bacterium]|nr:WD40 repeat domain-containing protein [Anaerolineaceae bacterium]